MEVTPISELQPISANILDAVGNTPLVRLPAGFDPEVKCEVLLKLEFMNPSGSIKDRIALHMVRQAEKSGALKKGGRIVECSSGNTGAGLAMVAAALGYDITVVIPDKMSPEKIAAVRGWGADVVVTPANVGIEDPMHYTKVAGRIAAETEGAWWPDQYHNPDNTDAHYQYTGAEIFAQCDGRIDHFIAGAGTGGTISGIGRYLKEHAPNCKVVGVDPVGSVLEHYWRTKELIEGGSYAVEGVGEEEVPRAWDASVIDDYLVVNDKDSFLMARKLARATGIFAGGSSGFNLAATLRYARNLPADARVVTLLPDYGKAYLSKVYNDDYLRDCNYLEGVSASTATVGDLCSIKNTATLSPNDTITWGIRQAGERQVRPLPVIDNDNLLGIFDEDKAIELLSNGSDTSSMLVRDCLDDSSILVLDVSQPWQDATAALAHHDSVLVKDADGYSSLSRNDLLRSLTRLNHTK
ncbi:MAG: pyridoxal-phosphate dependent enzyme [Planctomycetota bacterium]|nr:pyridoxal-phosphate dependent enzyme [Planctomycetota bacterium]